MSTHTTQVRGINSAEVARVGSESLELVWPRVLHLLQEHPHDLPYYYDAASLYYFVANGRFDLWVGVNRGKIDIAALLSLEAYPVCTIYRLIWVGGEDIQTYLGIGLDKIEQYAHLRGAQFVETEGRKAWHRLLGRKGYDSWPRSTFRKSLIKGKGN